MAVLTMGIFALAVMQVMVAALQDANLRGTQTRPAFTRLPPLETIERILFKLIAIGFLGLTIVLVSSFFSYENIFAGRLAGKTVITLLAWLVFLILLLGRHAWGWRGRVANRWALFGSGLLMVSFLLAYWL